MFLLSYSASPANPCKWNIQYIDEVIIAANKWCSRQELQRYLKRVLKNRTRAMFSLDACRYRRRGSSQRSLYTHLAVFLSPTRFRVLFFLFLFIFLLFCNNFSTNLTLSPFVPFSGQPLVLWCRTHYLCFFLQMNSLLQRRLL